MFNSRLHLLSYHWHKPAASFWKSTKISQNKGIKSNEKLCNVKCAIADICGATPFGQLKIGQLIFGKLNLVSYFMQIRLDLEGLNI